MLAALAAAVIAMLVTSERRAWSLVFKRIRDSSFVAAPTWTFGMTVLYVIQDHPVYIPCDQRWPLRPELAVSLGVWPSSRLVRCAGGCAGWRLSGAVAVLGCCTATVIGSGINR